jgi:hypothetical protein
VIFEVIIAVTINSRPTAFFDVALCSLVGTYRVLEKRETEALITLPDYTASRPREQYSALIAFIKRFRASDFNISRFKTIDLLISPTPLPYLADIFSGQPCISVFGVDT